MIKTVALQNYFPEGLLLNRQSFTEILKEKHEKNC